MEPDEAEQAVAGVVSSKEVATKTEIKDMATKADMKDVATKADIAKVNTEIEKLEIGLKYMQWVLGLIFVMDVAILIKLFFNLYLRQNIGVNNINNAKISSRPKIIAKHRIHLLASPSAA